MIPFSMRLLHAELPHYLNRSGEALDRLYFLSAVVSRVRLSNIIQIILHLDDHQFDGRLY